MIKKVVVISAVCEHDVEPLCDIIYQTKKYNFVSTDVLNQEFLHKESMLEDKEKIINDYFSALSRQLSVDLDFIYFYCPYTIAFLNDWQQFAEAQNVLVSFIL